ncbi:hypothetical protein FB451DRAFT_1213790 [Mycena latifolia]|nr:hypothetical protein FB451DRAFT_1213790 [Mycena latifolia]
MILDIVHLVLLTTSYYVTSVTNFGDYRAISTAPWSLQAQIVVGVLLSTLVQIFYAFRVWTLWNKSPYMPAAIVVCSLAQLGLAIAYMVTAFQNAAFKDTSVVLPFSTSALSFEVATDILISGSMIYCLSRGHTGFRKTDQALKTLTTYVVNSGLLVMIFAICCLATFITSTTSLIYGLFFFILVRLYGCSFMSILNSREYVRDQLYATNTDHAMVTIPSYSGGSSNPGQSQATKHMEESATGYFGGAKGRSYGDLV